VDFTSAEIKSNDDVVVPTDLSYQWSCVDYPDGYEPVFVSGTDTELYASATFSTEGWYIFQLKVTNQADGKVVGADLLWVRIDIGVEIVVAGKNPVSGVSDERTYEANIDDTLNLSANFGPPSPLPHHVQWWAPYEPVTIVGPTLFDPTISFDTPGLYPLELYAFNDRDEVIGKDQVWIEVQFPMVKVSAGPDRTLYLQKNEDEIWEVSDQFNGTVEGVTVTGSDRVKWTVEAADDNADVDSVSVVSDPLNPKAANITFGHYGAYYVVFRAWKNTSQGEVFLGTGAAATIVTYQQVELVASADDSDLSVTNAPATCNLLGEVKEGHVDYVEWVFPFPGAPDGLVEFASPDSWSTMVSFNEVVFNGETFSGAGTYPIILLGKVKVGGEELVVASATVVIEVEVTGGTGGDFTHTICISPHFNCPIDDPPVNPPALPWNVNICADIEEGLCGSTTGTFEDYDYAVWSWSGSDNSVVIHQPDLGIPVADVLFNKAGTYILTLVVKNGGELLATTTMTIGVAEESCTISAFAGFNTDMSQEVLEDIAIGETINLYGQALVPANCINSQVKSYWSCGGSSDAADLDPVQTTDPDVQATVTFSEPGDYPLTLRVVNAQTQELLASKTILAVVPPLFRLDISGPQFTVPGTSLALTATILGLGAPTADATCTWSTNDSGVTLPGGVPLPVPYVVPNDQEVQFEFDGVGTYELTVEGNVDGPVWVWSQITGVTVWVSEDFSGEATEWCAGSTKYVTLPEPAHMSDALFVTTEAGIIPKWSLVSGPADVTFLPEDSSETPYVKFYEPGDYKLSLVPWDVQAGAQKSGTDASEVYVFVFAQGVHNPDVPLVTLGIEDGTSDNLKVLTANAKDKDGVSYLMLKLGDETLAEVSGDPGFYRELELVYELDISHLPADTSTFRAYAWDTIGYMGPSNEVDYENNSAIRDFKVSPETIDDDTVDDLTFTASFDEARDWELKIYKADGSFVVESPLSPGVGDPGLEDYIPLSSTTSWANGNYSAVLTVPVAGTDHTGTVHFRILRGQISSSDITAELDNFVGTVSGNISLINEWSFPDFALGPYENITDFDSPIKVIKDGRGEVSARLGNPDFPYDTEYRLQVGTVDFDTFRNRYYFNPIQVITPFDVPHDAMGWAPTPSQPVASIGVDTTVLGTVDLSMLENGNYYMQLSVRCDGYDYPKNDYAQFILDCPLKIGNVKFSQEDLVVETGGIPLRVVRTYDSFKKEKDSEFGHGWAYSIANLDIELDETRLWMYATDFTWDIDYTSPISTRYGGELTNRNVTLTLPDGRRTTFMFYLDYHSADWSNAEFEYYTAEYMSMPGIDAELRAVARGSNIAWWDNGEPKEVCRVSLFDEEYPLYWEGVLGGSGEWGSVTQADSSMYDFCSYVLKMGDGTEYYFERNTLTGDYYDGGEADWLCFYGGDSILDAYYTVARGHPYLTRIKTADGEEINLNTDLTTGLIGANGGIECKDAQGNDTKSLQIVYYEDETPNKGRIWYINAPSEDGQEPVNGKPTLVYEYDDEGNLTKVKKLVNKNAAAPEEQYDETEYLYEDQTHYPADHYVTDIKDSRGLIPIRYFYDAAGRLTETIDAKGNHITIEHDVAGKVEMVYERWDTDKIYPVFYEYNERGNVTWIKRLKILPEPQPPKVLEETEYYYETGSTYTDSPREVRKILPDDPDIVTKYDYDKYGKPILTVDPEDNVTETFYYDDGNVKWVIQGKNFTGTVGGIPQPPPPHMSPPYEDGGFYTVVSKTYNTYEGSKLKTTEVRDDTDTRLQMTVNIYDGLNRLVNTVQIDVQNMTPDDFQDLYNLQDIAVLPNSDKHTITSYSYNGDDLQPSYITNPAGSNTYFSYDDNGNQKLSYYAWDNPINSAGVEKYVYTVNSYDDQGRVIKTERILDNDADPFDTPDNDCFTTVLSETKYDSLGKVEFTIDQHNNVTKYEYDQVGLLVETRTFSTTAYDIGLNNNGEFVKYIYDPGPPVTTTEQLYASFNAFETDADTSHLTTSRTLYDTEGRVLIAVGPYDPAVYDEGVSVSEWPVGTETVYDVFGRVIETRRWAGVRVDLMPFKVIIEQSQPAPCQPDDPDMVGKMIPVDAYPANAWNGTGTEPTNIGWSSERKLPVIIPGIAVDEIDDFVGPLSYSRTVYDDGGRVKHSVNLQEAIEDTVNGRWIAAEQPTTYYYDMAGKQTIVIDPLGHDISSLTTEDIALYGYTPGEPVIAKYTDFTTFDDTEGTGNLTGTHKTETAYDGTRRSAVTDARDKTTSFEYDDLGRLEKTIHPLAKYYDDENEYVTYSHLGYDGLGRKKYQSETTREAVRTNLDGADGLRWFDYDVAGRLSKVTLPAVAAGTPVYKYFYDDYGNQIAILDPLVRMTVFEYDESNRQTAKYMPFAFVDPTPGDGEITVDDVYDALDAALPDVEYRDYDLYGRLEAHTDYKEQTTGYFYNKQGQLQYKRYYLFDGTVDGINQNYDTGPENNWAEQTEYTYDTLGRRTTVEEKDNPNTYTRTTTYHYDAQGRLIQVDTPQGTINYGYNPITGRKINTNTAYGNTNTNYYYDELGRLAGTGTALENTYYHYDEAGNRKWLCIDRNGDFDDSDPAAPTGYEIKTDYTYDPLNRLTDLLQKKTGEAVLSSYIYTLKADGHRHSLDETLNETRNITYGYDDLNRLTDETATSGSNGYDIDYTYDLAGNRTERQVTANGPTLTTTYDYFGTDKLYTETHSGPVYAVSLHENDRYYAYATPNGGYFYRDTRGRTIGSFWAFFMGLPSVWSRYVFILAMALVPVLLLGPGLLRLTKRYVLRHPIKVRLRVPRKGIYLLVAFVMLLGPESFHNLSQADVQYANLNSASWANGDTTITYTYDNNGSVETKTTVTSSVVKEVVTYHYNLAGRLARMWTDTDSSSSTNTVDVVDYKYNDDGIRVEKYSFSVAQDYLDTGDEQTYATDQKTTTYLVDSQNHTGYAQTLEELTFNKANPDLQVDTPDSVRTYLIGDDVIAQTVDGNTQYLLYDGHGSTRQLAEYDGSVTVEHSYSYDGYGVLLQDKDNFPPNGTQDPGKVAQQATSMLYAGEHFDTDSQNYYLRARWYDSLSGRFNRMDPFAGSSQDPQSLHKYLYCHNNPVNTTDPTGMMTLIDLTKTIAIKALISGIVFTATSVALDAAYGVSGMQMLRNALFVFGATVLAVMSAPFAIALIAAVAISLGVKALSEGLTKEDGVRVGAFLLVAILLSIIFKNCTFFAKDPGKGSFNVKNTFKNAQYKKVTLKPGTVLKRAFEKGKSNPRSNYTTRGKTASAIKHQQDAIDLLNLHPAKTRPTDIATLRVSKPVEAWVGKVEGGGTHAFQYYIEDPTALDLVGTEPLTIK
jgi:RHS repeat-associated protein